MQKLRDEQNSAIDLNVNTCMSWMKGPCPGSLPLIVRAKHTKKYMEWDKKEQTSFSSF